MLICNEIERSDVFVTCRDIVNMICQTMDTNANPGDGFAIKKLIEAYLYALYINANRRDSTLYH